MWSEDLGVALVGIMEGARGTIHNARCHQLMDDLYKYDSDLWQRQWRVLSNMPGRYVQPLAFCPMCPISQLVPPISTYHSTLGLQVEINDASEVQLLGEESKKKATAHDVA